MKNQIIKAGLVALFATFSAQSQYLPSSAENAERASLTGSLHSDFILQSSRIEGIDNSQTGTKAKYKKTYSPLAAGLLSAVVPGAGQFYTKTYWQSAAFFGAEVITWIVYASYEKKGDQQTAAFQHYADEHWSVVRYTDWVNINFNKSVSINQDQTLQPWERVDWGDLNTVEEQIGAIYNSGFTHKLAPYSDQQYYEMIGKYSQFGGGWDDAAGYTKADVIANDGIGNVTRRFSEYSDMRGKANKYYNIATTVSYVIVANHILSALEAAFNAAKINHRIRLQGHIQSRRIYRNLVEFVPTLQVNYEL